MKILVLSCSTGGGHNSCARYITEEFRKNNISCDFVDYFSIMGPKVKETIEKIHLGTTKGNGNIFKYVYKLGETYSKTGIPSPVYGLNKIGKEKLYKFIKDNKYNLVITTHLFPSMAVTSLKKDGYDIKLINVATDYRVIPFWEETTPDYFIIPHKKLIQDFVKKGFKREIIFPFGIPISSTYQNIKNDLNLPKDKDIILVTSGSIGFGKMKEIIEKLLIEIPEAYIIGICGENKKLYDDLKALKSPNLLVKGYVNNFNEYIKASTIVLSKPGGLTSTEVCVFEKPMVHLMPIPGVESYNTKFFAKNGLCLSSNSLEEVIENTKKLLKNKKLQTRMVNNQNKTINKNSAKELVELVKDNIKE